ncbi:serine hydrolase domain-containing protein [Gallaecimonas mangrovi]|uniref:serine hydrolase domain-containing protein n=1 Tax=Gallaecimonas mangrovi TaxID=2291597 RepID=UPI000E1FFF14|nr:serine hydrolase domain-containing protein [Gallaecimonas mangrovi]
MTILSRVLAIIAFCLISQVQAATIKRLDGSTISSQQLTKGVNKLLAIGQVTGLSVTVFNDAKPVYSQAFGYANVQAQTPLTLDTEIYGASISKAVFATLVMQLVDKGVIDLDTPLYQYLDKPLWQIKGDKRAWHRDLSSLKGQPEAKLITARMCLSHTTGLGNWRWFEPDHKLHFHAKPGSHYRYSGEGMTLLQTVLEQKTGKTLEELAQEYVFTPFGMASSSYQWQPRFEGHYATGYNGEGRPYPKDKDNAPRSASTLETTPNELTHFVSAVLQGAGLTPASYNAMFSPQIRIRAPTQFGPGIDEVTGAYDDIALSYGLGWGLIKTPFGWGAFKEGRGDGCVHYLIVFPKQKMAVLLLSNSENAEKIIDALLRLSIADSYTPVAWERYADGSHLLD